MANTSLTQQALAADATFIARVKGMLIAQAFIVLTESPIVAGRVAYARRVLSDSNRETALICSVIVTRTNLMAFTTSYDFTIFPGRIITAAGDPDILSQIATDWNAYAGI